MAREERVPSKLAITMADERQADFGTFLRQAREQRGLSLQELAVTTKISARVLEALERNDPGKLPGGIFSRAFVRAYAREVGLDPDVAVASFVSAFPDNAGAEDMPAATSAVEAETFESRQRLAKALLRVLGLGLVAAILGLIYYSTWGRDARGFGRAGSQIPAASVRPGPATPAAPMPAAGVRDEVRAVPSGEEGRTPSAEGAQAAGAPTAAGPLGQPVAATPTAPPAGLGQSSPTAESGSPAPLVVGLTVSDLCWVSISVDGARIPSRNVNPGERLEYSVQRSITMTVGNAGAVTVTLNGKPAKPLGGAGRVVTTTITAAAYQSFLQ